MNSNFFKNPETESVLNAIGENVFITDAKFDIVFLNNSAKKLIKKIGEHIHIKDPDNLIGMNMDRFHVRQGDKQKRILTEESLPHNTKITLFKKYVANIIIDKYSVDDELKGYILTWKDVTEFEEEMKEGQKKLEEMYTPIIPTTLDNTLLVPIVGSIDFDRISKMTETLLSVCAEKQIDYMVLDFTGTTKLFDDNLVIFIDDITKALRLMGVEVCHIGFSPELVRQMVKRNVGISAKVFKDFKAAVEYICKKENCDMMYRLRSDS